MPLSVFISYRRSDASADAGRLSDALRRRLRGVQVFMDVDSLRPGQDWLQAVKAAVAETDVLLALIGRDWLAAADAGERRLDNEFDPVRLEIEAALDQGKPVIPVLLDETPIPRASELPSSLGPLVRRHAISLSHATFAADLGPLLSALRLIERERKPLTPDEPAEAAPARPTPVPVAPGALESTPARRPLPEPGVRPPLAPATADPAVVDAPRVGGDAGMERSTAERRVTKGGSGPVSRRAGQPFRTVLLAITPLILLAIGGTLLFLAAQRPAASPHGSAASPTTAAASSPTVADEQTLVPATTTSHMTPSAPPAAALIERYPATGEVECGTAGAPAGSYNGEDYRGALRLIGATDPSTVVFYLCAPDDAFLAKLAANFFIYDAVVLTLEVQAGSYDVLIGTGPYSVDSWARGDAIFFSRFLDYWGDPGVSDSLRLEWIDGLEHLVCSPPDPCEQPEIRRPEPQTLFCPDEIDAVFPCMLVMEGIYELDDRLQPQPALATDCVPSDDGLIWTCHLREGVTFHDGSTFGADDVIESFAFQWDAAHPLHVTAGNDLRAVGQAGAFEAWRNVWGDFLNGSQEP